MDAQEVPHPMSAVIIRLADEGIPVRAIARATKVPSDEVYEALNEGISLGAILEMPKDDWPVGSNRASRSAFRGTPLEDEEALKFSCARFFKATPLEAAMLAVMLKRVELTKAQLHQVVEGNRQPGRVETDPKIVDVVVCHLRRKLKPFMVEITTVRGIGYMITPGSRDRAIAQLLTFATAKEAA
jgi:hypothetical protein